MRPLPRLAWFYIWIVALSAGAVLVWLLPSADLLNPERLLLASLAGLALILTETHPISIRPHTSVSVSTAILFAEPLILDLGPATWATAIGMALAYMQLRRRWYNVLFNTGACVLTVFLTGQVYRMLNDGSVMPFSTWPNAMALLLSSGTFFLVNSLLVSTVIDLRERLPLGDSWSAVARGAGAEYFCLLLLGTLGALIYEINRLLILLLVIPVIIVYDAYKTSRELRQERDRLIDTEEMVRKRLQMELHDGLAQSLAAMTMRAGLVAKQISRDPAKAAAEIAALENDLRAATKSVRYLLYELRPLVLETHGLVPALEGYIARLQQEARPRIHLEADKLSGRLEHRVEISVFGIIQEALNNILKHAQATNVWVRLEGTPERFQVVIRDDGKGFNMSQVQEQYAQRGSFGLLNMRERAARIGGDLQITSEPGKGTTVTLSVSL